MDSAQSAAHASGRARVSLFDGFTFDHDARELRRDGELIPLQPQPAKVLEMLLDRSGSVVTRDELRAALWDDQTFVDFDRGLNYCISQVRAALGDRLEAAKYLETLRGRGYRFLITPSASPAAGSHPIQVPARRNWRAKAVQWTAAAALFAMIVAALGLWRRFDVAQRKAATAIGVAEIAGGGLDQGPASADLRAEIVARLAQATARPVVALAPGAPANNTRWKLEVRVIDDGGGVRVAAALVDTRDGSVHWSQVFEISGGDWPAARGGIATRIATGAAGSLQATQ